jgi:2-methylcitrate dehydratase PrpD
VVACALVHGHFGWDSYARLHEAPLRGMMAKVTCVEDPEVQAEFPANMSGRLTLRARGREFSRMVVVPKGEPGNFLSEAELRAKFHGLADAVLGAEDAVRLADAVLGLPRPATSTPCCGSPCPRQEARLAGE